MDVEPSNTLRLKNNSLEREYDILRKVGSESGNSTLPYVDRINVIRSIDQMERIQN